MDMVTMYFNVKKTTEEQHNMSPYCLSKCLEDAAVEFELKWWGQHHIFSQNIHCGPSFQPHYCPDAVFTP